MVCLTWQEEGFEPQILWHNDPLCEEVVTAWLTNDDIVLVGQTPAFDMAVICVRFPHLVDLVFAKYRKGLVTCTKIRQQLLDIAAGCFRGRFGDDNKWVKYGYKLDDIIKRARGSRLSKDGWRLAYSFFLDTPLQDWDNRALEVQEVARGWLSQSVYDAKTKKTWGPWPEAMSVKDVEAIIADDPRGVTLYPLEDARATLDAFLWQEPHAEEWLQDQFRQAKYAFAMALSSIHGIRTSPHGVAEFERVVREDYEETKQELILTGLVRPDGSRNMKLATAAMVDACERLGLPIRLTDGGKPTLEKDACDAVDDPTIRLYSQYQTLAKVISNDVPMLRSGTIFPIHPRYDLADTGRSTATSPNIQALRRKKGIREAFVPRRGKIFAQADYEGLELHTLAQVCTSLVGFSKLGEAIKAGSDPHLEVAARILEIAYDIAKVRKKDKEDHELNDARQAGKVCNFGFPVGLGPDSLVLYARKTYGVTLDKAQAIELKRVWLEQWPEMREYFDYVSRLMDYDNTGMVEQLFVKRFRGGSKYTGACSAFSQGLGGDCAKNAMWLVADAQYADRSNILFGSRTVAFVHDEIIVEVDDDEKAPAKAKELGRLMLAGANVFLPDCPARIEPLLMDCWSKSAKPLYDDRGELKVWRLAEHV